MRRRSSGRPRERGAVVSFGEALLVFKEDTAAAPDGSAAAPAGRAVSAGRRFVGGSELNTASALASLGHQVRYLTVLPKLPLADAVRDAARNAGVDVSQVKTDESPDCEIGVLHYVHKQSVYQRRHSSFCKRVDISSFDWDLAFKGASAFCCSGVTPSLSVAASATWGHAVRNAARRRVPVAVDLGWRTALAELELVSMWKTFKDLSRGKVVVLLVAADSLEPLCELEGIWRGPDLKRQGALTMLRELRRRLRVPMLACCFSGLVKGHPGWRARWSAVAAKGTGGEEVMITTRKTPVHHSPTELFGGPNAWLAGFVDGCIQNDWFRGPKRDRVAAVEAAARRADLLAALAQEQSGLCMVPRSELALAEAAHAGRRAGAGAKGTAVGAVAAWHAGERLAQGMARCRVIVAVRPPEDPSAAVPLARALRAAGIAVVQVDSSGAQGAGPAAFVRACIDCGIVTGAVCVMAPGELSSCPLELAKERGVTYIATPGVCETIASKSRRLGMVCCSGVATNTNVADALRAHCSFLSLFPAAAIGGPRALRALTAAYPHLHWAAYGGIERSHIPEYLSVPSVKAVIVDLPPDLLRAKRASEVEAFARGLVASASVQAASCSSMAQDAVLRARAKL